MNLYRLDYIGPDGHWREPVTDLLGPRLFRQYARARTAALEEVGETRGVVAITRIDRTGHLQRVAEVSGETYRVHRVRAPR